MNWKNTQPEINPENGWSIIRGHPIGLKELFLKQKIQEKRVDGKEEEEHDIRINEPVRNPNE